ncbi:MAG: hypothetical protein SWJ54_15550 [Cyanobacteriota bacterium]|nr:hypothetical protein [Cyanobacteriota bacterium]
MDTSSPEPTNLLECKLKARGSNQQVWLTPFCEAIIITPVEDVS